MFCTSPTWGVEAITSLIPIQFHLNKIIGCLQLYVASFSKQHTIISLLDDQHSKKTTLYCMVTSLLILKQQAKIKSLIIDINNCLNEVLSSFDSLNIKLSSGFRLVDTFSDCFSFTSVNCNDINALKNHHFRLDRIYKDFLNNQDTIFIIVDTSIKNNIATLVFHIQKSHNIINKSVHHTINVNSTEVLRSLIVDFIYFYFLSFI